MNSVRLQCSKKYHQNNPAAVGGVPGRQAHDVVFILRRMVEQATEWQIPIFVKDCDVAAANDNVLFVAALRNGTIQEVDATCERRLPGASVIRGHQLDLRKCFQRNVTTWSVHGGNSWKKPASELHGMRRSGALRRWTVLEAAITVSIVEITRMSREHGFKPLRVWITIDGLSCERVDGT